MANGPNPLIEVENVRRSFRSVKKKEGLKGSFQLLFKPEHQVHEALKGITFSIDEGSFVGLIGANGAGKTTLLKILSGLIPPTSGHVRVLGYEPFSRTLDFRRRIALVMGQKAQLWWDLPAIDAFELLRAIYEIPRDIYKKRLDELAAILDVGRLLNTQIRRLSLGERMKMELIGALLHWPEVIFLDEPTIGLDVIAASSLRQFLRTYNQLDRTVLPGIKGGRRSTMILTSHNMDDIERLCSRVLVIKNGELIFDGSPQKLMVTGEKRLRVRLAQTPSVEELARVAQVPLDAITAGAGVDEAESDEETTRGTVRFKVTPDRMPAVLQSLMGSFQVVDMGVEEQSLEDVISRVL